MTVERRYYCNGQVAGAGGGCLAVVVCVWPCFGLWWEGGREGWRELGAAAADHRCDAADDVIPLLTNY